MEVGHLLVLNEDLLGLELSLTQQTGQLVPVSQLALVQYPRILLCPALFIIAVAAVRRYQSRLTTPRRCGTTRGVSLQKQGSHVGIPHYITTDLRRKNPK